LEHIVCMSIMVLILLTKLRNSMLEVCSFTNCTLCLSSMYLFP
jgi:hypothetical protein